MMDIIFNIVFSLGLMILVWYFFIKEKTLEKLDIDDDFSVSLDDYEKELGEIIIYPKLKPLQKNYDEDFKELDREQLSDEEFETLYQETKLGEKIVDKTVDLEE